MSRLGEVLADAWWGASYWLREPVWRVRCRRRWRRGRPLNGTTVSVTDGSAYGIDGCTCRIAWETRHELTIAVGPGCPHHGHQAQAAALAAKITPQTAADVRFLQAVMGLPVDTDTG